MTKRIVFLAILLTGFALSAGAQEPPVENPDQLSMLKSDDPQLARTRSTCSISGGSCTRALTWTRRRSDEVYFGPLSTQAAA